MPYVKLNELNLFYEEFGKGEAVLFLHSHFSRGLLAFSGQILAFSGYYRCLYPDFRGHGRTTCDCLDWNSRMLADDMANFLDSLNIKQAHLIGYSGGAYPRPEGATDFLPESLLHKNNADFIEDMKLRHFEAHRGDWQTYLKNTVSDWQSHPLLTDTEWESIKCPSFFINGENDPFGTCTELQEKVPNTKVYEVKGGGHRPHFVGQQAEEINALILDFLHDIDQKP